MSVERMDKALNHENRKHSNHLNLAVICYHIAHNQTKSSNYLGAFLPDVGDDSVGKPIEIDNEFAGS
ncbi:hypothetical protein GCM10009122_32690 [Fulvivirga kasyanovii]|tara:strand:+ start:76 stop:276 length:201 start_codon:yes stop_codon:yes gene_type:complete